MLVVHGDCDRFFPPEIAVDLYRQLPDAERCILPRTGHGVPRRRPACFRALALDFLELRRGRGDEGDAGGQIAGP